MQNLSYESLPDEGGTLEMEDALLHFIPAHYLHASGNFNVYDPKAKLLMSGDVGAALEDAGVPLFVDDFAEHIPKIKGFHQRWMPSNRAKNDWIARVRELDIHMMMPQHGRIFKGEAVGEFLEWFQALDVGVAV